MLPKWHIILGALFSFIIWIFFPQVGIIGAFIIFFSSFLIDFDHYLWYAVEKKDLNLKRAYKWYRDNDKKWMRLSKEQKNEYKLNLILFHGIEFWLILFLAMFFHYFFGMILLGFFIHMFFDFIDMYVREEPMRQKISTVYTYIKNKNKEAFI